MATSGTTSYSVNELDIFTDAFENAAIYGAGETLAAEDIATARRKLNMIVKQWVAQVDFAPGLKMWTRRTGYLFFQQNQTTYSLGPTGDEVAAESYVSTTLSASATNGATTVTLTSVTGVSSGMRIGVLLASGSMHWTTVSGAPSGQIVTLGLALSGAASAGDVVYVYTSKIVRPFEIEHASLRDSDGNDQQIDVDLLLEEYESIGNKSDESLPSSAYFEAQRTNAKLTFNCAPSDLTYVVRLRFLSYVEDSTATTDTVDFPAEWYRPLSAQLTIDLCPAFRRSVTPEMLNARNEALKIAQNAYPAKSVASYESEPDCY